MTKFQCFIEKSKSNAVHLISGCLMVVFFAIAFIPLFIVALLLLGDTLLSDTDVILLSIGGFIIQIFWVYCLIFPLYHCYIQGEIDD